MSLVVPTDNKELVTFTTNLVEECRVSVDMRAAYYRLMNSIAETGRYDGNKSLINLLYKHLERTSAHIFSPVDLKFSVDFENSYPKEYYERSKVVAKQLRRGWEKNNTDILFGRGTFESLKYGAAIVKQYTDIGPGGKTRYNSRLVMPWQFGVYNEADNDLNHQHAMTESTSMTLPEIWGRIWHLKDADKLYLRIVANARKGSKDGNPESFFHQVLSTSQLQTGVNGGGSTVPGGIIALNTNPNYAMMGPTVAAETVDVHEVWVQDGSDYTTILMVEPDIIIAPLHKKENLIGVPGRHPYTLIQPNEVTNWIWGRSELVDLIEPQMLLSVWADDLRRLFGLQIDKILGMIGEGGPTDELYGQMRNAGVVTMPAGGQIVDLTPKMPPEAIPMLKFVIDTINTLSGFPEIMRGQGEPGVRAGVHAGTLLKTASPTLRDRALLVERQCAGAAQLYLDIKEAKNPQTYWTKGETDQDREATSFRLTDLPEDRTVIVDSHSSSPIFADENTQLIMASHTKGIVTSEYVIDNLPYPNKEMAKALNKEAEASKSAMMQKLLATNPEVGNKVLLKSLTGGKG